MFRRLFGNKSEFDDEVKSKFVTLMSDILKIQTIPTGGKSTKDERDNLKRKALGYVYGFIDAALQVRGQDMDVSVGVPITFQVIRMLWPDHVNECMDYLIKNIKSDPLLQAGVMHGGQQYLDFHNHNRHPFGLGIFLIEEDKGLNDTSSGQKSLTSSRQMLRYSADARWDDLAWMEFEWIPGNLIANWVSGVKAKHERHGWESMAGILWDQDTMVFIGRSNGLMEMLKVATKSRKSSKRHEAQTYLASIVLSIECLGCDFAGWGERYPNAKKRADEILNAYFKTSRTRLLDVYMPLRSQLNPAEIREVLGPKD